LQVIPLQRDVVKDIKPALLALFIGAGVVLLISCFNVANLLLGRANSRRKKCVRNCNGRIEMANRSAVTAESMAIC